MSYKSARTNRRINSTPDRFQRDLKAQSMRQCMQGEKGAAAAAWWRELRAMRALYRRGPKCARRISWRSVSCIHVDFDELVLHGNVATEVNG